MSETEFEAQTLQILKAKGVDANRIGGISSSIRGKKPPSVPCCYVSKMGMRMCVVRQHCRGRVGKCFTKPSLVLCCYASKMAIT